MIGCDIVHIPTFLSRLTASPEIITQLFTEQEILDANGSIASLAGKFAAKEACCKALQVPAGNWQRIIVVKKLNGMPSIHFYKDDEIIEIATSISHDGDYAMAVVLKL